MTVKKPFCDLQFPDAFMFAAAMEDEEVCRGVLERILTSFLKALLSLSAILIHLGMGVIDIPVSPIARRTERSLETRHIRSF